MWRHIGLTTLLVGGVSVLGCGEDELRPYCASEELGFDIEKVSALEDCMAWSGLKDAVTLDFDRSGMRSDDTWRVVAVDVLVLIPEEEFAAYPDNVELTVEVYDANKPQASTTFSMTQTLNTNALSWTTETFSSPPATGIVGGPDSAALAYRKAWWSFSFHDIIPQTIGLSFNYYTVAISWSGSSLPLVGYSQVDRPCEGNWTNYDAADPEHTGISEPGWIQNSNLFDDCNWPMLRVQTELRQRCS